MAEHYGVVPKRFSKEWWPYFWMYYKWHTIGSVLVLLLILMTVVQCAASEQFDMNVNYIGKMYFSEEVVEKLQDTLEQYIEDVDGNGEENIFFQQMTITNAAGSEEMDYALQMKHDLELSETTSFLYMYDKDEAELMFSRETSDDVYMPVSEWLDGDIPEDRVLYSGNGNALAVLAEGSELLESTGMDTTDLYIAVRMNYSDEDVSLSAYRSAVAIANAILK